MLWCLVFIGPDTQCLLSHALEQTKTLSPPKQKHWIYSLLNDNQNQSPVLSLLRIEIEVSLKLRSTSVLKCSEDYGQIHLSPLCVPTMLCYSNWIFTACKEQCSLIHTSLCSLRLTAHQICAVWIQMFVYPLPSQPVPI